jgi:hypothetical protein
MKSKWFEFKSEAIRLRKQGKSLPYVHTTLGIPKSTLSYWFKNITLTDKQKCKLRKNWQDALKNGRTKAVRWHNEQKALRVQLAEQEGLTLLRKVDTKNVHITELALALLYLGEGTKAKGETGMGSSDPLILKFFISCLRKIYHVPEDRIKCELHLRSDQDPEKMLIFWSHELQVAKENFYKPYLDIRTKGTVTYDSYKGVCLIRCGTVAIQRKLVYIAKHFCKEINAEV